MKKLLVTLAALALFLPSFAFAVTPLLTFDNPTVDGGTVAYDGLGGAFQGTNVIFQEVIGVDTPLHSGVSLFCYPGDCLLSFATGANIDEGPPIYRFNGGGSLTLVGGLNTADDGSGDQISPAGTLLASNGTFDTPAGVLTNGVNNLLFVGTGSDLKDVTLTDFYGITGSPLNFANTEISLALATFDANGGFTATVTEADFANAVPEPGTLMLFGSGIIGLGVALRRKYRG